MTAFPSRELAEQLIATAWTEYGAKRTIDHVVEVSAHVSTNRVFRVVFNDSSHIVAKISSYGSYFLFAEDHDRLFPARNCCVARVGKVSWQKCCLAMVMHTRGTTEPIGLRFTPM